MRRRQPSCCIAATEPNAAAATPANASAARLRWLWAALLVAAAGCADAQTATCRVDGDCASRRCGPDGLCQDYALADADASDASPRFGDASGTDGVGSGDTAGGQDTGTSGGNDGAGAQDSGNVGADSTAADAASADTAVAPWTCAPNHDGRVDRIEIHFAPNLEAPFRVATQASFQPQGTAGADGKPVWDLAAPLASDKDVMVSTEPVAGRWFSADFAGATYASRLATDSPLLGIFEATGDALLLRGVVSPEDGLLATKLVYDPPAQVLAFPLQEGTSFSSASIVTGKKDGVYALWNETWTSVADHRGIVQTPYGNFPALRVRTTLTRKVGIFEYVTRSFAWVAECYGTVASARSKLDESTLEFTTAEELRRLAVPK